MTRSPIRTAFLATSSSSSHPLTLSCSRPQASVPPSRSSFGDRGDGEDRTPYDDTGRLGLSRLAGGALGGRGDSCGVWDAVPSTRSAAPFCSGSGARWSSLDHANLKVRRGTRENRHCIRNYSVQDVTRYIIPAINNPPFSLFKTWRFFLCLAQNERVFKLAANIAELRFQIGDENSYARKGTGFTHVRITTTTKSGLKIRVVFACCAQELFGLFKPYRFLIINLESRMRNICVFL